MREYCQVYAKKLDSRKLSAGDQRTLDVSLCLAGLVCLGEARLVFLCGCMAFVWFQNVSLCDVYVVVRCMCICAMFVWWCEGCVMLMWL